MKGDELTDDKEIIKLYFDRDERAIDKTSEKYGRYCMDISMNILNSKPDAEECVNDTYLKTWSSIPPQSPQSLKLFLATITRRLSLDRYKSWHTAKRNKDLEVVFDELTECAAMEEEVSGELSGLIQNYLLGISQTDRVIFVRRYWFAESPSEIAKKYGMTYSNVMKRLHKIRMGLKEYLEGQGYKI